jgi:hypothetical protein
LAHRVTREAPPTSADRQGVECPHDAGPINAAARWMLGPTASRQPPNERIAEAAFRSDRLEKLLERIAMHVHRARRAITLLRLHEASRDLEAFDRHIDAFAKNVHHARVDALMAAVCDRTGLGAA